MKTINASLLIPVLLGLAGCMSASVHSEHPERAHSHNKTSTELTAVAPAQAERHARLITEAGCFFRALFSTAALPSIPADAQGELCVVQWVTTTTQSFSAEYPFRVRVDVTLTNTQAIQKQMYAIQKVADSKPWTVAKGWIYNTNGALTGQAVLPSQSAQDAANAAITGCMNAI